MSESPGPAEGNRRRLPKSKTGCRTCKKRKVKVRLPDSLTIAKRLTNELLTLRWQCDEGRPACRNCVKHGVECDLFTSAPSDPGSVSSSTQISLGSHESSGEFTLNDLELLHHYTTSACLTFSTDPMVRNFWRVDVPQIGFNTPYILKGMFSLSALHLAKFRPERKDFYLAAALSHHNTSVSLVSRLILTITSENCIELFLFSTITNYFAFGKPREPDSFLLARHGVLPDWLMLFRGVRAVMESENDVIRRSPVAAMFETGFAIHEYWISHTFENETLRALEANIRDSLQDDPEKLDAMMLAMDDLKRSYAIFYGAGPESKIHSDDDKVRGIFIWLFKISKEFIALVGEGDSEALCILAYFCVLMRRLDFLWWMEGWGLHLIECIYSRLNATYRCWIRWPIEEIGWVPNYKSPSSF